MPGNEVSFEDALRNTVRAAAGRADVRDALAGVYNDLAAAVEERRPVCVVSGRCCRFEDYGHRLFVTTIELAGFVAGLDAMEGPPALTDSIQKWDGAGCPFQVAKMCGVHAVRPFGCRMFFCDATSTQWQNEAYEAYHARLKRLHEQLAVPYFYVEWRQALRAVLALSPVER